MISFYFIQVSMVDDGVILFPSLSFCKKRTFDQFPTMLIDFLDLEKASKINIDLVKSWTMNHIWNRSTVFKLMSHSTQGAPPPYSCTTISGEKPGKPCSFPFVYPDCTVIPKPSFCKHSESNIPITYTRCSSTADTKHWCSTQTHWNNSYIEGEWGYCSNECVKVDDDTNILNDLQKGTSLLEEILFNLDGDIDKGHCYTYNPEFPSFADSQGTFYALLGK